MSQDQNYDIQRCGISKDCAKLSKDFWHVSSALEQAQERIAELEKKLLDFYGKTFSDNNADKLREENTKLKAALVKIAEWPQHVGMREIARETLREIGEV